MEGLGGGGPEPLPPPEGDDDDGEKGPVGKALDRWPHLRCRSTVLLKG